MLDKSTERILRRMDRMGFAGAGEALSEIDRLRQETLVQSEAIETLRLENSQWQSACAGYTEALAARDRDNTALREELTRIRDQIAKHNISIKEAIRRGEAFEWKTLTLDS